MHLHTQITIAADKFLEKIVNNHNGDRSNFFNIGKWGNVTS